MNTNVYKRKLVSDDDLKFIVDQTLHLTNSYGNICQMLNGLVQNMNTIFESVENIKRSINTIASANFEHEINKQNYIENPIEQQFMERSNMNPNVYIDLQSHVQKAFVDVNNINITNKNYFAEQAEQEKPQKRRKTKKVEVPNQVQYTQVVPATDNFLTRNIYMMNNSGILNPNNVKPLDKQIYIDVGLQHQK